MTNLLWCGYDIGDVDCEHQRSDGKCLLPIEADCIKPYCEESKHNE